MRIIGVWICILLFTGVASSYVFADQSQSEPSAAIIKMAEIMKRLKHFPSPLGKQTLQALIDDPKVTVNERIIANAILNLQHKAMEKDQLKLQVLMKDAGATKYEKTIADVVNSLDHRPSKEDKNRLKAILEQ